MYMKSENGEIEVFLCPEDENSGDVSVTVNEPTASCSSVDYLQQTMSESVVGYNTEPVAAAVATAGPD
jgi:hypothetical protein